MVKARNLDDILRRIMPIINVQLIRDWETGVDDNYQFSLKFRWRMKNLFKYEERTNSPEEYYAAKREFEILGRVAACIIAFLGITMLPSMHTYATAFALSSRATTTTEGGLIHSYNNEYTGEDVTLTEPTYIPEGYREEIRVELDLSRTLIYRNDNGDVIEFSQYYAHDGLHIGIDAEYDKCEVISYEGNDLEIYIHDDRRDISIYYENGHYVYVLSSSNISKFELLKILISRQVVEEN